jgi:hypothetical protein
MQPNKIKRRTFLQALFGAPLLTFLHPRVSLQTSDHTYTDDIGTADLSPVHDNDLLTGLDYQP